MENTNTKQTMRSFGSIDNSQSAAKHTVYKLHLVVEHLAISLSFDANFLNTNSHENENCAKYKHHYIIIQV